MPLQYKPGEVEIVRKVLEEIGVAAITGGYLSFGSIINARIKSLESVKEKWKPEEGNGFWYLNVIGESVKSVYHPSMSDMVKVGNCFPDKASCEVAAAKFIKMLEG